MKKTSWFFRILSCAIAAVSASALLVFTPAPTPVANVMEEAGIAISVEAAEAYFKKPSKRYDSIVDALKSIGADSAYSYREKIAAANGISNYKGTAAQNTKMLNMLYDGKLKKPGSSNSGSNESGTAAGTAVYNKAKSFEGKKYPYFDGLGFHWRAWCADFVSYVAKLAGQTKAIPKNASVAGIRDAIKSAGGKEYSKATVKNGGYNPKRGDIIIFKSNGASHVGIVDCVKNGKIYYVDGNNTTYGNGNASCVHYSNCSTGDSRFTCVLHPNYK